MDIEQDEERATRLVMLRLLPGEYNELFALSKRARSTMAAFCRKIIRRALAQGIEIVPPGGAAEGNGKR